MYFKPLNRRFFDMQGCKIMLGIKGLLSKPFDIMNSGKRGKSET